MQPKRVYYEPSALEYDLGRKLKEKYHEVPWFPIKSHNSIEELQKRGNEDFAEMKRYLIVGIRKTHKYVTNQKISDFLVPYTSSGCSAMCLYCYLVCSYNKCSYLRVYVNHEEMRKKLIQKSYGPEQPVTFEVGSNSDLILEHQVTGHLPDTIEQFGREGRGAITFPTKFSMVEDLLDADHKGKTIFRMSVNPQEMIEKVEIGTSSLKNRVSAVNKMCEAGYPTGLILAPVILVEGWQKQYVEMLDYLNQHLSTKAKKEIFIEVIFMTYSYVHKAINEQAFPDAMNIYNEKMMTGRGRGKYYYRQEHREEAEKFLREEINRRFHKTEIAYVV